MWVYYLALPPNMSRIPNFFLSLCCKDMWLTHHMCRTMNYILTLSSNGVIYEFCESPDTAWLCHQITICLRLGYRIFSFLLFCKQNPHVQHGRKRRTQPPEENTKKYTDEIPSIVVRITLRIGHRVSRN